MNFALVRRVLEAFEAEHVEYVVFGAAAINLLGWQERPRTSTSSLRPTRTTSTG